MNGLDANQLRDIISDVEAFPISADEYAEFQLEAKQAQAESINIIKQALGARIQFEEETEARRVEAERLEKIRIEQEAESKRLAEEAAKLAAIRIAEQERVAEAQEKIDAENRKIEQERQRLEAEKQAVIDQKEREKLEKRLAAEAKVQVEKDAKEKAEREEQERAVKEEAEAAEKARQEALKPDKVRLTDYANILLGIEPVKVKSKEAKILADKVQGQLLAVAHDLIAETRVL